MPSTEFVTNATSTSGGAVNRPFTFILKTCPAIGSDPRLAGLLKILILKTFNHCNGKNHRIRTAVRLSDQPNG
jgi:hypothetical protein